MLWYSEASSCNKFVCFISPVYSLGHSLHHLALNGTVSVVFAIEVLRLVTHSVACVPYDWDLDFLVVWKTLFFSCLVRGHRDLVACRQCAERFLGVDISLLETGTERVNIEKGVFSVVNLCDWLTVHRHMALIADRCQIHVCSLRIHFNALEPKQNIKSACDLSYSASWNSAAFCKSLASAGSISSRSRRKLDLPNSCACMVVKRSFAVGCWPF